MESDCSLMWRYIQAEDAVNEDLSIIDQNLERACEELSNAGIQGSRSKEVLKRLACIHPSVIDAGTIDANDTISEAEPEIYQYIKGVNVSFRENQRRLLASKHPVGSQIIKTIEGSMPLST
jgi:hypothetical protein